MPACFSVPDARQTALRHASAGVYTPAMHPTRPSSRSARSGLLKRRKALCLAAALPWVVLVAGCGQKGPLFHPPEPDEEDEDDKTSVAPPIPVSRLA